MQPVFVIIQGDQDVDRLIVQYLGVEETMGATMTHRHHMMRIQSHRHLNQATGSLDFGRVRLQELRELLQGIQPEIGGNSRGENKRGLVEFLVAHTGRIPTPTTMLHQEARGQPETATAHLGQARLSHPNATNLQVLELPVGDKTLAVSCGVCARYAIKFFS